MCTFQRKVFTALAVVVSIGLISANEVILPKWFSKIPRNEYVGISEPNGTEEQAIMMACFQYLFANQSCIEYSSICDGQTMMDSALHIQSDNICQQRYLLIDSVHYDILDEQRLASGEYVCRIAQGKTHSAIIKMLIEEKVTEEIQDSVISEKKEIVATISSNIGTSTLLFTSQSTNNKCQPGLWDWYYITPQNDTSEYQLDIPETQHILNNQQTNHPDFMGGVGDSPYSVCDNLLVCYWRLVNEVFLPMAIERTKEVQDNEKQLEAIYKRPDRYMVSHLISQSVSLRARIKGFRIKSEEGIPGIHYKLLKEKKSHLNKKQRKELEGKLDKILFDE